MFSLLLYQIIYYFISFFCLVHLVFLCVADHFRIDNVWTQRFDRSLTIRQSLAIDSFYWYWTGHTFQWRAFPPRKYFLFSQASKIFGFKSMYSYSSPLCYFGAIRVPLDSVSIQFDSSDSTRFCCFVDIISSHIISEHMLALIDFHRFVEKAVFVVSQNDSC